MNKSAPERGAGSDDPTGQLDLWQDRPAGGHQGKGVVRTGSSNAEAIDSNAPTTGASRSQSERDLDLPEAAGRRAEGRASGKSDGTRSDRSETSGGSGGELSAGWREVAEQLHAEEGMSHE